MTKSLKRLLKYCEYEISICVDPVELTELNKTHDLLTRSISNEEFAHIRRQQSDVATVLTASADQLSDITIDTKQTEV